MQGKYLAFDIETAKVVPGEDFNWRSHRPLGITCIASQSTECDEPRVWLSHTENGTPAAQMTPSDAAEFVRFLAGAVDDGFVPLSWNGLAFDLDVLAEESGLVKQCNELAPTHVDMMFHIVCEKGYPVSLENAASGMRLPGKLTGVKGFDAPRLWAAGEYDVVKEYVAQDVRTTLAIALRAEQKRSFAWTTRAGKVGRMPLSGGWLTVNDAAKLPLPDTSWMSNPPRRGDFMSWLGKD